VACPRGRGQAARPRRRIGPERTRLPRRRTNPTGSWGGWADPEAAPPPHRAASPNEPNTGFVAPRSETITGPHASTSPNEPDPALPPRPPRGAGAKRSQPPRGPRPLRRGDETKTEA